MRYTRKINKTLIALLALSSQAMAFAPSNFFKPYDSSLTLHTGCKGKQAFKVGANVEYGYDHDGKSWNSKSKNVLKLYEDTQSFMSSLRGAPAGSPAEVQLHGLTYPVVDDGTRGQVDINGKFEMLDVSVHGRYELPFKAIPGHLGLSVMLPIRDARVRVTSYADQTEKDNSPLDGEVADLVGTRAFAQQTFKDLGGLDWSNWSKTDVGDLVVMLDWSNRYEQEKDGLKAVELLAKVGVSAPTAAARDEDKAFSVALGNDGAWSLPFGVGLNLDFKHCIRLGADAQFEVIFDHSKDYRMKTKESQTRFMLLNKGRASMDYGFTWKFNLLAQAHKFAYGMSLGLGYQYLKHDDDRLSPQGNAFDASIVNSANWLKEYNTHNLVFKFNWDCTGCCSLKKVSPQLSLFYKLPIDGKNVMLQDTVGGQLAFNF